MSVESRGGMSVLTGGCRRWRRSIQVLSPEVPEGRGEGTVYGGSVGADAVSASRRGRGGYSSTQLTLVTNYSYLNVTVRNPNSFRNL